MRECTDQVRAAPIRGDGQCHDLPGSSIKGIKTDLVLEEFPSCFKIRWLSLQRGEQVGDRGNAECASNVRKDGLGSLMVEEFSAVLTVVHPYYCCRRSQAIAHVSHLSFCR